MRSRLLEFDWSLSLEYRITRDENPSRRAAFKNRINYRFRFSRYTTKSYTQEVVERRVRGSVYTDTHCHMSSFKVINSRLSIALLIRVATETAKWVNKTIE